MSLNNEGAGLVSFLNSTLRLKWKLTKEEFDDCGFHEALYSPIYSVQIGGEKSNWRIFMFPRGEVEADRDMVVIYLELFSVVKAYKTQFTFDIETPKGYWPNYAKALFSRKFASKHRAFIPEWYWASRGMTEGGKLELPEAEHLGPRDKFAELFIDNEMTIVATLVIDMEQEGENCGTHMEAADNFTADMRSMSVIAEKDFTVICDKKEFPCNKLILSARSKYFKAIFVHDQNKTETKIDDSSPEMVETLLKFMSDGLIPDEIDDIAMELIPVADKYGPANLIKVCSESIMNNLSPENAVETVILIDRHKKELREKVFDFIKKHAAQVVNSEKWDKLAQDFPGLVKDMFVAMADTSPDM